MKLVIFIISWIFVCTSNASENLNHIKQEFLKLRAFALTLEPDDVIGGLMYEKKFDDASLLWILKDEADENEVIRIYSNLFTSNGQRFVVSYYKSTVIVPERIVLRRFVGPDQTGWMNDTLDYQTGEYLGSQGNSQLRFSSQEKKLLRNWDVKVD